MNRFDVKAASARIDALVKKLNLPGVSVAVRADHFSYSAGFGYRDLARTILPDENTVYGIASCGKSMTCLSLALLECEGKLSLDDPVIKYLPEFRIGDIPKDTVTLLHLSNHTAGIPPMEPLEWSIAVNTPDRVSEYDLKLQADCPNSMSTMKELMDYIADCPYPTLGAPGEIMSYSNEGHAVLCAVVEKVSGMPMKEFLKAHIFTPLGMTRTCLDVDGSEARALAGDGNVSALYEYTSDGGWEGDEQFSILPPFLSCACVKSTAHDMGLYYHCLASEGCIDGKQILPKAAIERMIGKRFPLESKNVYCLGLNKRFQFGKTICEHAGGLHGITAECGFFPEDGVGFVVLCSLSECDVNALLWALYNCWLGLPEETEYTWIHSVGYDFSDPEMLVGTYVGHEGIPSVFTVSIKDGKLIGNSNKKDYPLVYCGENWFYLANPETNALVSRIQFHIRQGKAWAARVGTRVFGREEA